MATTFPVGADTSKAISDIDKLIAELRKAGKEAGLTETQINKMVSATKAGAQDGVKQISQVKTSFSDLNSTIKGVGATIGAVFAAQQLQSFVKDVIDITSQFQRLEAVLTNTLGSQSKAKAALADIQALAAKTPFSVLELTENFIKLANRGVRPTMEQMTKLGDVAATLGKPFEQVVEALLDINNPERWKEIGIKAETAGNKVKLTFRDTTVEVNRTVQGVTDAVVKLGEMQGVAGSMAAISETLGGKISNLGDAWDGFLKTVGDSEKGVLSGVVSLLTQAVEKAKELVTTDSQKAQQVSLEVYNEQLGKVKAIYEINKDIDAARDQALQNLNAELTDIDKQIASIDKSKADFMQEDKGLFERVNRTPTEIQAFNASMAQRNILVARYNDLVNEGQKAIIEFAKETADKNKPTPFVFTPEQLKIQEQVNERQAQYTREAQARATMEAMVQAEKIAALETLKASLDDLRAKYLPEISDAQIDQMIVDGAPKAEQGVSEADVNAAKEDLARIHEAEMRAIKQETFDFIASGIDSVQQIYQAQYQQEMADLQAMHQYELSLAGNNEKAKDKINKDFAAKQKKLQKDQAERSRDLTILDIVLNTSRGVMAALASVPPNVPLSLFVGGQGLLQLAVANATKLPKFKHGVFDLDGPGSDTSDNILSMLSPGESVVSARKTRKFKTILKPIIEEDVDLIDVRNIIDQSLPTRLSPAIYFNAKGADSQELLQEMKATRKAIENKRETKFIFDDQGFSVWTGNQQSWQKYVTNRYSF